MGAARSYGLARPVTGADMPAWVFKVPQSHGFTLGSRFAAVNPPRTAALTAHAPHGTGQTVKDRKVALN